MSLIERCGVQLQDGVGESGDAYERQADAVADAFMTGESAAPILDQTKNADAAGASVQMLKGNDAAIRSDTRSNMEGSDAGATTVGDVMETKVRAGTYDINWNNKHKVEFENKLAAKILGSAVLGETVSEGFEGRTHFPRGDDPLEHRIPRIEGTGSRGRP